MFSPNLSRLRSQLEASNKKTAPTGASSTKDRRPKVNYLEVHPSEEVVFFVLPPWKQDGDLARAQYSLYLAPIAKRHTLWRTFSEDLKEQDPVEQVLRAAREKGVNVKEVASFSQKFYLNVLVVARGPVGKPAVVTPEVGVLSITPTCWTTLLNAVVDDPTVLEPTRASPFRLSRTGDGKDTKWDLVQCGSVSPDGFTPHRTDVTKKYPVLVAHWERPLDLDAIWFVGPPVKQASRATAEALAAKLGVPAPTAEEPVR